MKIKKEIIILELVIIALSAYLALRRTDRTHYALPEIPPVDKKQISRLEISKAGHSAVLVREEDRWLLEDGLYPVEPAKADRMLDEVSGLTLTALVSESQSYERYGLDPAEALEIRVWAGKTLARSFAVGRTASTYRHTFVRLADDPKVYHAGGNMRGLFDSSPSELRDKTVLSFDPEQIHSIRIVEKEKTIALERRQAPEAGKEASKDRDEASEGSGAKKDAWVDASGQPVSQEKTNRLISGLSRLQCDHFLENRKKEEYRDPVIEITLEGSEPYVLNVFEKNQDGYPAATSMSPYPFILNDSWMNSLKTDIQELGKPDAPETPATNNDAG
jgi:hypothetical protein